MTTAQQLLWEIALDQHGFVTTDDARTARGDAACAPTAGQPWRAHS